MTHDGLVTSGRMGLGVNHLVSDIPSSSAVEEDEGEADEDGAEKRDNPDGQDAQPDAGMEEEDGGDHRFIAQTEVLPDQGLVEQRNKNLERSYHRIIAGRVARNTMVESTVFKQSILNLKSPIRKDS